MFPGVSLSDSLNPPATLYQSSGLKSTNLRFEIANPLGAENPQRSRFVCLRPGKAALAQTLGANPRSAAIEIEQLDPILSAVGKDVEVTTERIFFELVSDQIAQALETLAQVGGAGRQVNPGRRTQRDHNERSSCNKQVSSSGRKPEPTSKSIAPGKCSRYTAGPGACASKLGTCTKPVVWVQGLAAAFRSQS